MTQHFRRVIIYSSHSAPAARYSYWAKISLQGEKPKTARSTQEASFNNGQISIKLISVDPQLATEYFSSLTVPNSQRSILLKEF